MGPEPRPAVLPQCFIICEIGSAGTPVRARADSLQKHIISPALRGKAHSIRADQLSTPGIITEQIIEFLISSELVIADLTGRNPNVYYELAVRHAAKKACVQLIDQAETIPFDVAGSRTIQFNIADLDSVMMCRQELAAQVSAAMDPTHEASSPISRGMDVMEMRASRNPAENTAAQTVILLEQLRYEVIRLGAGRGPATDLTAEDKDFLTLRRGIRKLAREGVLTPSAILSLSREVQVESPVLEAWLASLVGGEARSHHGDRPKGI